MHRQRGERGKVKKGQEFCDNRKVQATKKNVVIPGFETLCSRIMNLALKPVSNKMVLH